MANQISLPEAAKVTSYLAWLKEKSGISGGEKDALAAILLEKDYAWTIEDDKNRAEDGLKWRERYADEVGSPLGKTQQDRIKKTIHGKTSCFEVILSLSEELDAMVNEDEESMTPLFFEILLENLGIFEEKNEEKIRENLEKWLENCDSFTIFPLSKVSQCDKKVSQTGSLWMLMNRWLEENSDENGHFVTKKCHSVTKVSQPSSPYKSRL